ncbi:uncharacterized protein BDW47DRAFT_104849 [Aspergillus candidus]|uniref:Uncharacterized protein n=1 Tax=Aspergillus candidus TaxID=41067 RepID=A0A2I2FCU8_ASPCN|nr:hypothetical protein BDW47DRAFT_104849 [Aspergillus candidus]PLB38439.1 hypothetical protein BDW47DRAFT_104849 [Aspergillus candidus]
MAPSQSPSSRPGATTHSPSPRPSLDLSPNFTDPSFDPADFLNDVLPPLTLASSQSQPPRGATTAPVALPELSAQVQSVLSQVNAQSARHSTKLTQLTDEILRSGARLAYEVEVLRGETVGLSDTLTETLHEDIGKFVPETTAPIETGAEDSAETGEVNEAPGAGKDATVQDPVYITNLRILNRVRARLEEVVQSFGDAMEWPLPPSETSLTSSFISVSAPEPGTESHSREEKGQEVVRKLRADVTRLLDSDGGGQEGIDAAARRVESLRVLAAIWKGTAEEKARTRFVESLAKTVDDRRQALESQIQAEEDRQQAASSRGRQAASHRRQESEGPAGGIFRNLQRLREEIYLE